jgi:hypothetical protein
MKLKASKISTMRTWALLLVLIGLGLCVFGTSGIILFGQAGKIIAGIFMALGIIACMVSMGFYFWLGMLTTGAPVIECPECGKNTKMLGETDRCMYCHTILTWNPAYATTSPDKPEDGIR